MSRSAITAVAADGTNQATMATSLPQCGQLMPGAGDDVRVSNADLALRVRERCRLTGHFVLRSGRVADEYFDKYQFEADPALLDEIATAMAPLVPEATEVLAGLEMGGIAVVTALGQRTGLPCAFVRKAAKPYGTARLAEGADISGRQVLVVEDVVTSGGQIAISAGHLRDLGAHVGHALCVIDRQEDGAQLLAAAGIRLHALLKREDLDDDGRTHRLAHLLTKRSAWSR